MNDIGPGAVISGFGNNWDVVVSAEIANWPGLITGVHDIRIGQQSRHVFVGVGEVQVRIAQATAAGE